MATDYTALDAAIVERISAGHAKFIDVFADRVYAYASSIAEDQGAYALRVVDKRLQALRKKGAIKFDHCLRAWLVMG